MQKVRFESEVTRPEDGMTSPDISFLHYVDSRESDFGFYAFLYVSTKPLALKIKAIIGPNKLPCRWFCKCPSRIN